MPRLAGLVATMLLLTIAPLAHASQRYDPRLRFRTISTPHFDIHYHQGEEQQARRLAALAEAVATELAPRLGRPRARVQVILVDQSDLSNGWATPIPYNLIEVALASPRHDSTIGNTRDWLRMVLTHEYTHVLHLERSRGLLGRIGRVFGRNPFFYPNLAGPPWQIEGLATYEESATSAEGRMHAGDFRVLMQRAAASGRFPSLAVASNGIVQWPGGVTPYLYGVFFHEYLARTYGEPSLRQLADATAGRLPYLGSRAYATVFKKSLGTLWEEFERSVANTTATPAPAARRLTFHGFTVEDPFFTSTGQLVYSVSSPHAFPALMLLADSGPVQLATRYGGEQIGAAGFRTIVYDQVEYVQSVALQSDLYARDAGHGGVRRLTRHARAADPDVGPDATIACVVQQADGRALATMPVPPDGAFGTPRIITAEPGVDYASPRWSPDGRQIVAERRAVEEASEIVIIDPATGAITTRITASARGRNATPAWSPDGRQIFFASDRDGGPFRIFVADLGSGALRRLETIDAAHSPTLSPDGRTLVVVGSTPSGYDLFSIDLADARWATIEHETAPPPASPPALTQPGVGDRPYSPLGTLLPRFWTPVIEEDGEDVAVGAATGGFDALGRHGYAVSAAWSTRARPDWYASYVYDRWRPAFFADVSDDEEPFRDGALRVREFNTGAAVTFRRVRRTQTVLGAFHAARETFGDLQGQRRALRGAWVLDTARRYGFSISDEEGLTVGLATEWTREALGADGNAGAAIAEARLFQRAGPRHAALAARVAGAAAWGDEPVRRVFAAGSSSPAPSVGLNFDLDAVALLRGFDTRDVIGDKAVVVNFDYRFPLAWVERGVGTWPLFLRSLHGAVFADAGAAWTSTLARENRRAAAGLELSADLVVGYSLPLTVSGGVALRHDPSGRSRGTTVFGRIGRAF